ncbi:MAG: hypothetical protein ACLFST_09830 [Spirochaetia bacterium]
MDIVQKLKGEQPARAAVTMVKGNPAFILNGQETFPFFALSVGMYETIAGYTASGINMFAPIVGLDVGWKEPDRYDWSFIDAFFYKLLETNRDAFFLPRLTLTAPVWWKDRNPRECIRYGLKGPEKRFRMEQLTGQGGLNWNSGADMYDVSLASEKWKNDTEDTLRAFLCHMENSPLVSRMVGYQVTSAMTGEWHYTGSEYLPDYSDPMMELCGGVPLPERRIGSGRGLLRDPGQEGEVMHFYREFHRNTAETILRFARTVKDVTDRRVLCGTFYCYITENVYIQECGHLSPMTILESPFIDYVACPYTYLSTNIPGKERWETDVEDGAGNPMGRGRGVGGDGGYRIPLASVKKHGKLFIAELDPTTYLEPVKVAEGGSGHETEAGTLALLERDLAKIYALDIGGWLYDFGHLKERFKAGRGWYDDAPMHSLIRKYLEAGREKTEAGESISEIAVFYSAESFTATRHWKDSGCRFTRSQDFFNYWFLDVQSRGFYRIGAPIDEYFMEDFFTADLSRYKLIIFPNAFVLSPGKTAAVKSRLTGSGIHLLTFYAPGFLSRTGVSLRRMEDLTGITFTEDSKGGSFIIGLPCGQRYGAPEKMKPRFRADDPGAEVLGVWEDGGGAGLVRKEAGGYISVYSGAAPLPPELLRRLGEEAGVTMISSRTDPVFGTNRRISVIASCDGERELTLPVPMREAGGDKDLLIQKRKIHMSFGDVRTVEINGDSDIMVR